MTKLPPLWNRNFSLMSLSAFLTFMSFYFLLPTLPMYLHSQFNAENKQIGAVVGIFTLAALGSRPFLGFMLDNGNKRLLYLASILLFGLLAIPYAFAPTLMAMIAVRLAQGLTWGGTTISGASLVVDFIPPVRRGEGLGIYGVAITLAMATGPLLATTIFSDNKFDGLFYASSALGLMAFLAAAAVKFPVQEKRSVAFKLSLSELLERRVLAVSFNVMFMSFTYGGLLSFIPLYAKEIGVTNPGTFFLVLAIAIGLARIFAGRSYDRRGPRLAGLASMSLMAGGFILLALMKTQVGFFLSAFILGMSQGTMTPTFQAMVNDLIPRTRRGAANSTYFTAFDLGIGTGTVSIGILADKIGLSHSFLVSAGFCVVGLAVFAFNTMPHFARHRLPATPVRPPA